jgi:phosphate transport system substrate-binding protein
LKKKVKPVNRIFLLNVLVASLLIPGCKPGTKNSTRIPSETSGQLLSGTISIYGAYALYPLAEAWAVEYKKIHPAVQFSLERSGTGEGLESLRSGKCQLAMISRPLTQEEQDSGWHQITVGKEAVVLIVNRNNPFLPRMMKRGINPHALQPVFSGGNSVTWGQLLDTVNTRQVIAYTRADPSGTAEVWANFIWKTQTDLKGKKVTGDDEMVQAVGRDQYAIGYCNLSYAYDIKTGNRVDNIQVVPLDINFNAQVDRKEQPYETLEKMHRAIWLGLYPRQLCRMLYFVTNNKSKNPVLTDFIRWSLTQGDSCVKQAGFCGLTNMEKNLSLDALEH